MTNAIGYALLFIMFIGIMMMIPGAMSKQAEFNERMAAHHFSMYGGMKWPQ